VLRRIVSPTNDPARHAAGGGTDSNIQWLLRSAPKGGGGPPPPRRFAHSDRACPKARQRLGMRQSSAVLDDAKNPHQTFSLSPNSEAFSENNTQLGAGSGVFVAAPLSRGGDVDLSLLPLVCARRATPAATERRSHSKPQLRSSGASLTIPGIQHSRPGGPPSRERSKSDRSRWMRMQTLASRNSPELARQGWNRDGR